MITMSDGMIFLLLLGVTLLWALAYGLVFFLSYLCREKEREEKDEKEEENPWNR